MSSIRKQIRIADKTVKSVLKACNIDNGDIEVMKEVIKRIDWPEKDLELFLGLYSGKYTSMHVGKEVFWDVNKGRKIFDCDVEDYSIAYENFQYWNLTGLRAFYYEKYPEIRSKKAKQELKREKDIALGIIERADLQDMKKIINAMRQQVPQLFTEKHK